MINLTDELYHSGRKGMKWYQHIFGDEAEQRRRAKRMKKNADKVAKIKEKMRLIEEKNKLSDTKKKRRAQINRMFEPDTDEALDKAKKAKEIARLKNDTLDEKRRGIQKANRIFEDPDANDKQTVDGSGRVVKKANTPATPQTSARAIARSMGGMSDEEVKKHLQRLTAEKSIRQLAAEEADRAQSPAAKYIKKTLQSAAGNVANSLVSYGTKKASDVIIGAIESKLAGAKSQPDSDRVNAQKTSNATKQYGFKSDSNKSWYNYDVDDGEKTSNVVDRIIDLTSAISGNKNTGTAVKAVADAVKSVPVNEVKQMLALPAHATSPATSSNKSAGSAVDYYNTVMYGSYLSKPSSEPSSRPSNTNPSVKKYSKYGFYLNMDEAIPSITSDLKTTQAAQAIAEAQHYTKNYSAYKSSNPKRRAAKGDDFITTLTKTKLVDPSTSIRDVEDFLRSDVQKLYYNIPDFQAEWWAHRHDE